MAGSKGGGTVVQQPSTTTQQTLFPPEIKDLFSFITPQLRQTLGAVPLESFTQFRPQQIAGLTPEQQQALAYFSQRQSAPILNEPEDVAYQDLLATARSVPGQAPGTEAIRSYLENLYSTRTLPSIQNEMALAGLGNSGAYGAAIADARSGLTGAMAPVLQGELARRDEAVARLLGIGNLMETRGSGRASEAFEMGELARQLEQAKNNADFAEQLRIQDLITGITGAVTGTLLPASLTRVTEGGPLTQKSKTSSLKTDFIPGFAAQFG